jgi:hypothetical protein
MKIHTSKQNYLETSNLKIECQQKQFEVDGFFRVNQKISLAEILKCTNIKMLISNLPDQIIEPGILFISTKNRNCSKPKEDISQFSFNLDDISRHYKDRSVTGILFLRTEEFASDEVVDQMKRILNKYQEYNLKNDKFIIINLIGNYFFNYDVRIRNEFNQSILNNYELRFQKIEDTIKNVPDDVDTLKNDVGTLKNDVGTLKNDVGTLKKNVNLLIENVQDLTKSMSEIKDFITKSR